MKLASNLYINHQLADELGVSATIRNWSKKTNFPKPIKNSGKTPIYKTLEINSWLTPEGKKRAFFLIIFKMLAIGPICRVVRFFQQIPIPSALV